jgi:hypothetical protein
VDLSEPSFLPSAEKSFKKSVNRVNLLSPIYVYIYVRQRTKRIKFESRTKKYVSKVNGN